MITAIVLISADVHRIPETAQAVAEAGLDMLHKPIKPWQLRQALCRVLKS